MRLFHRIEEVIRIKDKAVPGGFREERMQIRATVRSPIVTGPVLGCVGEQRLSLRTAAAELTGGGIGVDQLLTARTVADVDRAAQAMDVIYFNYVFVDKAGAIGHRATGRVPVRASRQGSHPKAAGGTDDWQGFIPADQMPGALTPFLGDFQVQFFASMRLVADMGDDEKVQAVVYGGVVDRQFHAHQKDQLPAWTEGGQLSWWFSPQQVQAHARHTQVLLPK